MEEQCFTNKKKEEREREEKEYDQEIPQSQITDELGPPDKSVYWKNNFLISQPKHILKLMGKKVSKICTQKFCLSLRIEIHILGFSETLK